MEKITAPANDDARKTRSDGAQSRERLLMTAIQLFAEQGFAKTSTREIALAAGANIASISYYFGDKAGLYRAAFTEPAPHSQSRVDAFTNPALTLREAMLAFYSSLLAPLKQGDLARSCMRLWLREMLEPTGLWNEEIDTSIKPSHEGMVRVLGRHMGISETTDDLARLAFSVVALAVQLMVTRDVVDKIAPQLLDTNQAIDTWLERMADYAVAMVDAEKARYLATQSPPSLP